MEKKDRLKGLSTRCEEIQEIMGRPPGWMLRWGILVIFLIVCALLIGCYFIRLPQTLPIKVYARTDIQSDSTFAKSNGHIASIMKSNSTVITKGDTILSCSNDTCMDYITSSLSDEIEITAPNVNKGTALDGFCKKIVIDKSNVMAFGDAMNDYEMLKFAKYSFAMGNAIDEIKNVANYQADSNANDGLARAVEEYVN